MAGGSNIKNVIPKSAIFSPTHNHVFLQIRKKKHLIMHFLVCNTMECYFRMHKYNQIIFIQRKKKCTGDIKEFGPCPRFLFCLGRMRLSKLSDNLHHVATLFKASPSISFLHGKWSSASYHNVSVDNRLDNNFHNVYFRKEQRMRSNFLA